MDDEKSEKMHTAAHSNDPDRLFFYGEGEPVPYAIHTGEDGNLIHCQYCGSLHPDDALRLLENGARSITTDMKYGWPHKFYIKTEKRQHKFYTVHMLDASFDVCEALQRLFGVDFVFTDDGVHWKFSPPTPESEDQS